MASITIEVNHSPIDEQISTLNKRATALSNHDEWDKAIACLREARALMDQPGGISYSINTCVRLPQYLHHAGRFDEAMAEFNQMLIDTPGRIIRESQQQTKNHIRMVTHAYIAAIYDKMRLACKREKLRDKAATYAERVVFHRAAQEKYCAKADVEQAQRSAAFEARRPARRSGSPDLLMAMNAKSKLGASSDELMALYRAVDDALKRMAFDQARGFLQKIAYTMVDKSASPYEKDRFKQLMTRFATVDPLYREVLDVVKPLVSMTPGLIQSKVYPHIEKYDAETIRYALYFAHELGDLVRIKKGRSYALYLPGQTIDG
jgi:tetratricopeptide (TPR) repeat protein